MHNLKWLETNHPKAYQALPECYRADSCLSFYEHADGSLCAVPAPGQAAALGNKEWVFVHFGALTRAGIMPGKWVEADKNWRDEEDNGPDSEDM